MFVWCFAFFFLVCFSFSFLWQAKPNIVSNLVIPCGPFGGTIYYLTEKYRMSPKKGAMVKTSSSLNLQDDFPLVFRIDISINVENHPGQKKNRNAEMPPKLHMFGLFSALFGGENPGPPHGGPRVSRMAGETPCCYLGRWARESGALPRQQLQRQEHRRNLDLGLLGTLCL